MSQPLLILVLLGLVAVAYRIGQRRALRVAGGPREIRKLHSLPRYYGVYTALWSGLPALMLLLVWVSLQSTVVTDLVVSGLPEEMRALPEARLNLVVNDIRNLASGNITSGEITPAVQAAADHYRHLEQLAGVTLAVLVVALALLGVGLAWRAISPKLRARNRVEITVKGIMILFSSMAIITTIGIVLSVLFEAIRFFNQVPVLDFLFGLEWSPQMALRRDQVGATGAFGIVPLLAGTALISAIYLSEYAGKRVRAFAKPALEILAGVPTVVYGFFAALTVAPAIRGWGESLGLDVSSESALAAGVVMGIMIIPFVSSLSDDVMNAVPQSLRDGSLAMGATQSETIRRVVFPAALPGIVGGVLLAVSRAIGETMIVVMAAGLSANLTANPLQSVTTVTVQIVTLLVGDQEFDSPKTLAAFALGPTLFAITLVLNVVALHTVRKYREQYE
jgi:phosphate transport system permease protein